MKSFLKAYTTLDTSSLTAGMDWTTLRLSTEPNSPGAKETDQPVDD